MTPIVKVEKLCKNFPGVVALDSVDLDVRRGEVHALLGANGAGKSTLINILAGALEPDSGSVQVNERIISRFSPVESHKYGTRVIFQEFSLVPSMTVEENILLGQLPNRWGILDRTEGEKRAHEALKLLNVQIDLSTKVSDLNVSHRQIVEIARAISSQSVLIAMDEPTSALSPNEVDALFAVIRILKKSGVSILYVSHRLHELFQISDRITILKDGRRIATVNTKETSEEELVTLMVGQKKRMAIQRVNRSKDEIVLEAGGLSTFKLKDITFSVRKGEIVGFWGLMGAGKTQLARALFGLEPVLNGAVALHGKSVLLTTPQDACRAGLGLVPEDRKMDGLVLPMSVCENVSLASLDQVSNYGVLDESREESLVGGMVTQLGIRTPTISQSVWRLSGGNQQKCVLARWLAKSARILLLDEPTRGIDVSAKAEIYRWINSLSADGITILLISSEIDEVMGLCDRIFVLADGRIRGEFTPESASEEKLMSCAIGGKN